MTNRKSLDRSSLGGGDVVNGGRYVMSVDSASSFVLFGETNSKSNSWRMNTHLAVKPYRRRKLKRYHIRLESATTRVWFAMM